MCRSHRKPTASFTWSALSLGAFILVGCTAATAQSLPSPNPQPRAERSSTQAMEQETPQETHQGTIQVTGQAQILVPAEQVIISFSVETEAASAQEASSTNASRMESVVAALRGAGLEGLEIETFGYSLNPEYRYPNPQNRGEQVISGYRARNNIRVTIPDVDAAGEILDVGIGAGANRVTNLQFQAVDTREARLEALREAVRTAREEAQTIADAMDVTLGPPLEVRGGATPGEPRVFARAAMMDEMAGARTPIEAGSQAVSANITIIYRILEKTR